MTSIEVVLTACMLTGGSFAMDKFQMINDPSKTLSVSCAKKEKSQDKFSCIWKYQDEAVAKAEGASADDMTYQKFGKDGFFLINESTNQVLHVKGKKAVFHNRALLEDMSFDKTCVGNATVK